MNRAEDDDSDDTIPIADVIRTLQHHRLTTLEMFAALPCDLRDKYLSSILATSLRQVCMRLHARSCLLFCECHSKSCIACVFVANGSVEGYCLFANDSFLFTAAETVILDRLDAC